MERLGNFTTMVIKRIGTSLDSVLMRGAGILASIIQALAVCFAPVGCLTLYPIANLGTVCLVGVEGIGKLTVAAVLFYEIASASFISDGSPEGCVISIQIPSEGLYIEIADRKANVQSFDRIYDIGVNFSIFVSFCAFKTSLYF